MLAQESEDAAGFEFVWMTDGVGWKSARNNLHETFAMGEHLYSIDDLEKGIFQELFWAQ